MAAPGGRQMLTLPLPVHLLQGGWPASPARMQQRYAVVFSCWAPACAWGVASLRSRLAFGFGVDLATQEDGYPDEMEPEGQDDHTGEGAVGLAVGAESGHVEGKPSEASRKMAVPTRPPG
jgi:hypothetical protein